MKDLLLVIYMCWTPTDTLQEAVKHGYILESNFKSANMYVEEWNINGRQLEVVYTHPRIGNQQNVCYFSERWTDESNIERFPLSQGFDPNV